MKNVHKRRRFEPHRWRTKVEARATHTPPVNVNHMCVSHWGRWRCIPHLRPLLPYHKISQSLPLSSLCFHTLFIFSLPFSWTTTQRKETKASESDCEKERRSEESRGHLDIQPPAQAAAGGQRATGRKDFSGTHRFS